MRKTIKNTSPAKRIKTGKAADKISRKTFRDGVSETIEKRTGIETREMTLAMIESDKQFDSIKCKIESIKNGAIFFKVKRLEKLYKQLRESRKVFWKIVSNEWPETDGYAMRVSFNEKIRIEWENKLSN